MKNLGKLAALGAALAVSSSFAFAAPVQLLGSYGTGDVTAAGIYSNTALSFNGAQSGPSNCCTGWASDPIGAGDGSTGTSGAGMPAATNASVEIGAGTPWANAQGSSSWVSYVTGTNPASGPLTVAPQGYYTFTSTFSVATTGNYGINLSVLADDTTAIYLNGLLEYGAGPQGNDGQCSNGAGAINCVTPTSVNFGGNLTGSATDTLTFVVEQTGHADFGLDFVGSVGQTPEPSSLMLLGTGLTGAAGMLFRRRRSA